MRVLLLLALGGCSAQLASLATPPADALRMGAVNTERGYFETREDCERRLQEMAAEGGATHVSVQHHDGYASGVSYHFPETARSAGCTGLMFRDERAQLSAR